MTRINSFFSSHHISMFTNSLQKTQVIHTVMVGYINDFVSCMLCSLLIKL